MIKKAPALVDSQADGPQIILVHNWVEELKRLVPTP